jgi:hypothetical protein
MSGSTTLGVFCSPFFVRDDPNDGRIFTSILADVLNSPNYEGLVDADVILPGATDIVTDSHQNVIGGGVPVYGVCMHVVMASAATINELDAVPDVWRIKGDLTEAQRTSVEARLREKGMATVDLSGTGSTLEMAGRVAQVLQPTFQGFPEPFKSAFPD